MAPRASEEGPLLSQEQRLRRAREEDYSRISRARVLSVLGTIFVLLVVLFAAFVRDYESFRAEVKLEQEVVHLNTMVETRVEPANQVLAETAGEWDESEVLGETVEVVTTGGGGAVEPMENVTTPSAGSGKEGGGGSVGTDPETKVRRYANWQGFNETEGEKAARLKVEAKFEEQIAAMKEKVEAERKGILIDSSSDRKRQLRLDEIALGKLEDRLRKSRGFRTVQDESVEAERKRKYESIHRHYQDAVKKRDFVLDGKSRKIVDSFDGSLKPPRYCYFSPRGTKVTPMEPAADSSKLVRGRAEKPKGRSLLRRRKKRRTAKKPTETETAKAKKAKMPADDAEGVSLFFEDSKEILELASKQYPCLVMHQDCFNETYLPETNDLKLRQWYEKNFFKASTMDWESRRKQLEDFKKLRLGSCAVVGNADNVLKGKYGKVIDEHDFVIRYNVITKPFAEAVGTKTDGLFDKLNYIGTKFAPDIVPSRFNLFPKYIPYELRPTKLPNGKKALIYGHPFLGEWRRDAIRLLYLYSKAKHNKVSMEAYGQIKIQHASGGFSRVRAIVELLREGICDRVDLYGFSSGGGKYFMPKKLVSKAHPISGENYVYRLWMATGVHGKLCMYGD